MAEPWAGLSYERDWQAGRQGGLVYFWRSRAGVLLVDSCSLVENKNLFIVRIVL